MVEAHKSKIWNLLRSHIQDPELRKDFFQDILLEAWRGYSQFKGKASFGTWIYRIALNVLFLSYRKLERQPQFFSIESQFEVRSENTELSPQADKLFGIIQTLPSVEKSIITAHLDGYNNREIADILGISKNHVAVKLHRIKESIKSTLTLASHGTK